MKPRMDYFRASPKGMQSMRALQAHANARERERAALAWTEAVTRIGGGHVPDELYAATREHFTEEELVDLTLAVVAINGWNRLAIAFRSPAGSYRPGIFERTEAA